MAQFPALPLFTDAYLADTAHLSDAENGIYIKILMVMWRSPDCRIPNDDAWIARRFGKTILEVEKQIRPLLTEFCRSDGNWLSQKRLQIEWEWCRDKRKKNSDTAKSRWEKEKTLSIRSTNGHSERSTTNRISGNAPFPSLPSPSRKELYQEGSKDNSEERS
jgi:uncharacterized protein YdaU (DUF1376 family)